MTPFQLHHGRKPRTPITNLIDQPACLLLNWKKTNYILAQPAELQVFTIHDSDGELADYLVFNDSRKRGRSVSDNFKSYQFIEKETKPNAMKCRFINDKILTAAKETKHTITTTDGKTIHKKLASNLKFQPSKKADETRKPTKRCTRCGRFSNEDLCDTHKIVKSEQQKQSTGAETFPTMPAKQTEEFPDFTIFSDSQSSQAEELPSTENIDPEITVIVLEYQIRPTSNTTTATQMKKQNNQKTTKHQQFRHRSVAAQNWHTAVPPMTRTKPLLDHHKRAQIQ